jgi:hypothetical protein
MTFTVGDHLAKIIDDALANEIAAEEVMFEIFSVGALLGAANGNTREGLTVAVGQLIDAVYTKLEKLEAKREGMQ